MSRKKRAEPRTEAEFARLVADVARAVACDAVICVTESPPLIKQLWTIGAGLRLVAATPAKDLHDELSRSGQFVVQLPVRVRSRFRQAQHAISMAVKTGLIRARTLVVCAVARDIADGKGDLIVAVDVGSDVVDVGLFDLVRLTDGIRPEVLEAGIKLAVKVGRAARRGKRLGAMILLGDSLEVLKDARQLVPNPFEGPEDRRRFITDPTIHEMLVELAKLDGAFVVRGDGRIQTAAVFLSTPSAKTELPAGLGARHVAAAVVTATTKATAIVVSATDGNVRVFSAGELVLRLDPESSLLSE